MKQVPEHHALVLEILDNANVFIVDMPEDQIARRLVGKYELKHLTVEEVLPSVRYWLKTAFAGLS